MRKSDITPRSRIVAALRMLSLRSRERAKAMKDAHNTCVKCGRKASTAKGKVCKVQAHHKNPIAEREGWNIVIDAIRKYILVPSSEWECQCVECHKKEHGK